MLFCSSCSIICFGCHLAGHSEKWIIDENWEKKYMCKEKKRVLSDGHRYEPLHPLIPRVNFFQSAVIFGTFFCRSFAVIR